jgi:hypothetical protein
MSQSARCLRIVVALLGGLAIASQAMAAQPGIPLADMRLDNGQTPTAQYVDGAYVVRGGRSLEARVVAPADAFLCRLTPTANRDLVQLSIGRVENLRCNSLFSPSRDEAITCESPRVELRWQGDHYKLLAETPLAVRVDPQYIKGTLRFPWFRPLDKRLFPRAPAGWCSWYIYLWGIREDNIVRNTDWLAANLKKFGCEYVQLDDGWQGVGKGSGENRDWYVTDKRKFPHGMKWVADYIRSKGLKPGIWLIPFVTSDDKLFRQHPDMFIRRPDGTSVFETIDPKTGKLDIDWTGRYAIDPTNPAARKWVADTFHMICQDWGYDYVKIDGQGGSAGVVHRFHDRLADQKVAPDEAYRLGLAAARSQMKPAQVLLNCASQSSSCGYCDSMRTGADVGAAEWGGIQTAMRSTMGSLFMNSLCFWDDPDVLCVRPPLPYHQAQLWTTLLGITGQLLMTSDDMPALPEDRVELVRRVFPVADIRPMELYGLCGWPRIFDLRVSTAAGQWDVVALFNWDSLRDASLRIDPVELGLPAGNYSYYDVWQKRLLGVQSDGLTLRLPPTWCRVVAVRRQGDHPELIGTSRHLTQGADDLVEAKWDAATKTWSGKSRVVAGDLYKLRFTLPPGWVCGGTTCWNARMTHLYSEEVEGGLGALVLESNESETIPWQIAFQKDSTAPVRSNPVNAKTALARQTVTVTWQPDKAATAYRVYRNGHLLGQTVDTKFVDQLHRRDTYIYTVSAVGWQSESAPTLAGEIALPRFPRGTAKDVWLTELKPIYQLQDFSEAQLDRSIEKKPLRVGGKTYAHGLGAHAVSRIIYKLDNRYRRFEAEMGVDDEKGGLGTVSFQVFADDRKLFDSGPMRGNQPAKKVALPLDGAEELLLVVTDAGDGIYCDHADWLNARLLGNQ